MIELSVYEKPRKKRLILYIGIGIIAVFALYLLFPAFDPLYFFLPLIIVLIIMTVAEPIAQPDGVIYLTVRQISIKTNRTDISADLSGIRKLQLKYSGFKGKRLPGDFMPRFNQFSGNDNVIIIDLGTEVFKYRFYVEDEIKEKQIIELINDWESIGFDVSDISLNI